MKKGNKWAGVAGLLGWLALVGFWGISPAWAEQGATVTDVTARQRYPWNGLVDITCKVTGITGEVTGLKFAVAAVDGESGTEQDVSHVRVVKDGAESDDLTVAANGSYSLVWDARADLGEGLWSDMVVRVTVADPGPCGGQLWEGGPIWANRNIGAENPWNYGYYFWWGDTIGYKREDDAWVASDGLSRNIRFSDDSISRQTYGKGYATLQNEGWLTAAGMLAPKHDAAHMHWDGTWRMPTDSELGALASKCDWTWTTMNGVNGYLVRGRDTYAGNSIFLPAAGNGVLDELRFANSHGFLWSSVPDSDYDWYACLLFFDSDNHNMDYHSYRYYRWDGLPVRPVRDVAE